MAKHKILMLGASYGSLLATKLAAGGHDVHLVCLPAEADLINAEGAIVRMPVKGRDALVEINSKKLPGKITAGGTAGIDPAKFDLVGLAMQEPQYRSPGVRELAAAVAKSGRPCLSIMNMPPLAFLKRIPAIDAAGIRDCFADPKVWDAFDPRKVTLCSPDPQAFRPPEDKVNVLQVRLPTNFKAARFDDPADTAILKRLEADVDAARYDGLELPVKLRVHDSIYVPLAKWAMLLAGNYRCVQEVAMRPIRDAVHSDLAASRAIYNWVIGLCVELGANAADLVPFEKYAEAARSLASPSSAARALAGGAQNIERVDRLVLRLAAQRGLRLPAIEETVSLVDSWLVRNRAAATAKA